MLWRHRKWSGSWGEWPAALQQTIVYRPQQLPPWRASRWASWTPRRLVSSSCHVLFILKDTLLFHNIPKNLGCYGFISIAQIPPVLTVDLSSRHSSRFSLLRFQSTPKTRYKPNIWRVTVTKMLFFHNRWCRSTGHLLRLLRQRQHLLSHTGVLSLHLSRGGWPAGQDSPRPEGHL